MSTQEIKVSVCVVTYNQELYIAECLDSLVSQQTNFNFEIIVGEDCSTDGTRAILQKYAEKYSNLIVPLFYKENVGAVENVKQVYKKARGKYIAHMDGDDMALPGKLQKQFDLLEMNLDCVMCAHDLNYIDSKSKYITTKRNNIKNKLSRLEFIKNGISFCHSSKMFLNPKCGNFWEELLNNNEVIDYEIHLENLKKGKFIYLNEVLGQYRVFTGMSISSSRVSDILLNAPHRTFNKLLQEVENENESRIIKKRYALSLLRLSLQVFILEKDEEKFKKLVHDSIKIKFYSIEQLFFLIGTLIPKFTLLFFQTRLKIKYFFNSRK